MRINHEYEQLKDSIEEMHYEGFDTDQIFDAINMQDYWSEDTIREAIIEVEHRVNDVPNEGFYIEELNPYEN